MRGYYRALKRKEKWAVAIHSKGPGTMQWMLALYSRNFDFAAEFAKPSFFDSLPKADWIGGILPIPFKENK